MTDKYTCSICGGVFIKGRSDEEALADSKKIWGDIDENMRGVACEDCFVMMDVQFPREKYMNKAVPLHKVHDKEKLHALLQKHISDEELNCCLCDSLIGDKILVTPDARPLCVGCGT